MKQTDDNDPNSQANPAADLIREKISRLFATEPDVKQELSSASGSSGISKHQRYMYALSTSGKSLAEIQTEWHNYYASLTDKEKHEVWQEFYAAHANQEQNPLQPTNTKIITPEPHHTKKSVKTKKYKHLDPRTYTDIKTELLGKVSSRAKKSSHQNTKSLLFGLAVGSVTLMVLLFSFFNERFIAPFITPSRSVSASAIIIDPSATAVGPESKIIIPKINVELPVNFDETSISEQNIENDLQDGVVHFPSTSYPGELGNGAIFGHSSNNILNKGKYKFAFVLLKRLENGDTFIIQYHGKRYVYQVYDKQIVNPSNVSVLGNTSKPATFTLITCDPPGTSLNRLVVWGEQISPSTDTNTPSTANNNIGSPAVLPSNSPSLWQRIRSWL